MVKGVGGETKTGKAKIIYIMFVRKKNSIRDSLCPHWPAEKVAVAAVIVLTKIMFVIESPVSS